MKKMNDGEMRIRLAQSMILGLMDDIAAGKVDVAVGEFYNEIKLYAILQQIAEHIEEGLKDGEL